MRRRCRGSSIAQPSASWGLARSDASVARRLQGFDCTILAHDLEPRALDGVEAVSLDELLRRSDIVTLHVPLNHSTQVLVGARELALLRPGAILVNTSRGGVVDEAALYTALTDGRLRAAALDVFSNEPPIGTPLLDLPNVVLTPHTAGLSVSSVANMLTPRFAVVVSVLHGGVPDSVANPDVLAAR